MTRNDIFDVGHVTTHVKSRFALWVKHVCALSADPISFRLDVLPFVNSGLFRHYRGKCRIIHGRTPPLQRLYEEQRLLKCYPGTLRDFLTLRRISSCTPLRTWGGTPLWPGWYRTACTAELCTSDRLPSLPACRWPCCPSSPHLPSTTRPCPPPSCRPISTVRPVLWCGALWSVWWAVGSTPSSWRCLSIWASLPGTTQPLCPRRAIKSASVWTFPSPSWGEWEPWWCFRPFLEPTWAPETS